MTAESPGFSRGEYVKEEEVNYLIFRLKTDLNFKNTKLRFKENNKYPLIRFVKKDFYDFIYIVSKFNKFEFLQYKTDISELKKSIKIVDKDCYTPERIKEHENNYNRLGIIFVSLNKKTGLLRVRSRINGVIVYFGCFKNKSTAKSVSDEIVRLKQNNITDINEYLKIKEKYKQCLSK